MVLSFHHHFVVHSTLLAILTGCKSMQWKSYQIRVHRSLTGLNKNVMQVTDVVDAIPYRDLQVDQPSVTPSGFSDSPSALPSFQPVEFPSLLPSDYPSSQPSDFGALPSEPPAIVDTPSDAPSTTPSSSPFSFPVDLPSSLPSDVPSLQPSKAGELPSERPAIMDTPSDAPSSTPSDSPSSSPLTLPVDLPSSLPSDVPSLQPSKAGESPSERPAIVDTPSDAPSSTPSDSPSGSPLTLPVDLPSSLPSDVPSLQPSKAGESPSERPAIVDTPSDAPSSTPSDSPSSSPLTLPVDLPTSLPSNSPSVRPSKSGEIPSEQPVIEDTPSAIPSTSPSNTPIDLPTSQPIPARPVSETPVTTAPVTKPVSGQPVTATPFTGIPRTSKPATAKPISGQPVTRPATSKPATAKPVTAKPVTAKPDTAKPVTGRPATVPPTSVKPSTMVPTTAEPVTRRSLNEILAAEPDLSIWNSYFKTSQLVFNEPAYTVFVSTNSSFESYINDFPSVSSYLIIPGFILHVRDIIKLQVTQPEYSAAELIPGLSLTMVNSETVTISNTSSRIKLTYIGDFATSTALVEEADLLATDGVLHTIDSVLESNFLFTSLSKVIELNSGSLEGMRRMQDDSLGLSTLWTLINLVPDVLTALTNFGQFTLFAPNDAAFAKLGNDTLAYLLDPNNANDLIDILFYHTIPSVLPSFFLQNGTLATVEGGTVAVLVQTGTGIFINDALVLVPDQLANNGILHVIDTVLDPFGRSPTPRPSIQITEKPIKSPRASPSRF